MNLSLHFAFEYLDRGWPVIPVIGKSPAVAWTVYQQKRPTRSEVRSWFRSGSYNLAIITGAYSGLVVVDCDGEEYAHWWLENYPHTPLAAKTGGGGSHFYYRYPETEVRNRQGVLERDIDIRAEGGLVVAPPSVHPETFAPYEWEPWDHFAIGEVPLFDPAWIEPPQERNSHVAGVGEQSVSAGRQYIRHIVAVSGQGGHNATFRAACKLRDAGLSEDEALRALADWNESNAHPPWSGKELAHKVGDAFRVHS